MKVGKDILGLVIVGVVLRVLLSAFLFHTDVKNIYIEAKFINSGWKQAYHLAETAGRPIYYPPLVYTLIEANRKIGGIFFSNYFDTWLADGRAEQILKHLHIFRDLLAMKIPWILADFGIAWLLLQIVAKEDRKKVLWLWLFNPLTLYAIYGFANYDVLPTLAVVASLYFTKKDRWNWSYLALGLAAGLKLYGLLLLPVLFLIDTRPVRNKMIGLASGVMIFVLSTLTAWVDPLVFKSIFLSNLSNTLFGTRVELSHGFYIPIFLTLYSGFLLWLSHQKKFDVIEGFSLVIGFLLALSYFNPQWIVWMVPLLVLAVVSRRSNWLAYLFVIGGYFLIVFLFNDKFVTFGMFKAMNNAFDTLNPLVTTIEKFGMVEQLAGIGRALFLSGVIWTAWHITSNNKGEENWKVPSTLISTLTLAVVILLIFVASHYILMRKGQYILVNRDRVIPKFTLTNKTVITQKVGVDEPNVNAITIRLKNFVLRTKDTLMIKVANKDSSEVRELPIDSGAISDDYDLNLNFTPIKEPKGEIVITLSMPDAKTGQELLVPYDEDNTEPGLYINNEPVKGSLAFMVFNNPGGLLANLRYTLNRMVTRW